MATWCIRKSGSNLNGGTSATVRSTVADGVVNTALRTKVSSLTAAWSAADVGHYAAVGDGVTGIQRRISAFTAGGVLGTVTTVSGSTTVQSGGLFTAAMVGQIIVGPGIPNDTVLQAFTDASHMTMSAAAGAGFGTGSGTLGAMLTSDQGIIAQWVTGTARIVNVGGAISTLNALLTGGAGLIGAGESCYVGAGVYRETVAMAVSGSAGLPISVIGDVDGAVTGDPGEIVLTNYLTSDTRAPSATTTLAAGAQRFLAFSLLTIVAGGTGSNAAAGTAGSTDVAFTDCTLIALNNGALTYVSGTNGTAVNWTIDRCSLWQLSGNNVNAVGITLGTSSAPTGHWDANIIIRNSAIFGQTAISIASSGALASKPGGVRVYNSMLWGFTASMTTSAGVSAQIPCEIHNCVTFGGPLTGSSLGNLVEDHNILYSANPRSNVAIGPATVVTPNYAPLFDFGQAYKVSGIARPFMSPSSPTSPLLAFGQSQQNVGGPASAFLQQTRIPPGSPGWRPPGLMIQAIQSALGAQVPAPTYDWANRPRPSGTRSNLPTVGYLEYHDGGTRDAVTFDVGPYSLKFVGNGDQDLLIPVDAGSQTISIRCLYDTLYPSNISPPTLALVANGEIGVAADSATAAAGAPGTWQTLSISTAPTAAGILKIRLTSYDNSGLSQVNFDTFSIA